MIKCCGVAYRQGFIDVEANVHDGHVNVEAWNVHPDCQSFPRVESPGEIKDDDVIANTEVELGLEEARRLRDRLSKAIASIKKNT